MTLVMVVHSGMQILQTTRESFIESFAEAYISSLDELSRRMLNSIWVTASFILCLATLIIFMMNWSQNSYTGEISNVRGGISIILILIEAPLFLHLFAVIKDYKITRYLYLNQKKLLDKGSADLVFRNSFKKGVSTILDELFHKQCLMGGHSSPEDFLSGKHPTIVYTRPYKA